MHYEKDIGFAFITGRRIDKSIINIFRKAYELNRRIFRKTPSKFRIVLCDNEKEVKREARYYYKPRITATVLRDNTLVTRSPEFIEKKGRFSRKDFPKIINHEMNHVFWNDFYKATCKPVWLLEGFACYAGGNALASSEELKSIIKEKKLDYSVLHYRYIERKFAKVRPFAYEVWGGFTRFIIRKHGAQKITRLMEEYSKNLTRENYDRIFRKIFGKSEKSLFKDFLRQLYQE